MIKNLDPWKKILLMIIAVLVAIRILYIGIRGETDRQAVLYGSYDLSEAALMECRDLSQEFQCGNTRLYCVELVFDDLPEEENEEVKKRKAVQGEEEDSPGTITLCIFADDDLLYKKVLSLESIQNLEWNRIYVNARTYGHKRYKLTLTASEDCTRIPSVFVVKDNAAPEIISSKQGDNAIEGQIAVNYGYLSVPGLLDRAVMISLWMMLLLISFISISHTELIIEKSAAVKKFLLRHFKEQTLDALIELILCSVIIASSQISFQETTKIILYVLSLLAVLNYKGKSEYVESLTDSVWKKGLLVCLYLYAAFALVGHGIWIYPLDKKITIPELIVYAATVLWFVPVIKSALYYSGLSGSKLFTSADRKGTVRFAIRVILLLLIPAAVCLYAYNPGITAPDTLYSMVFNAQHLHGMKDWHPFFYCLMLRLILEVWNSPYMVIIVQYIFYAYVFTELLLYLRFKGIKDSVLTGAAVFTGFNVVNYTHINTILKDIPYTLSLLWAFIIIAKLVLDHDHYKGKWYLYFELAAALTGTGLIRKNGIVTFVVVGACLVPLMRRNLKIFGSVLLSIGIMYVVNGPLYSYFEVKSSGNTGMYVGLGQDILGAYYSGGEVSEGCMKMITEMTDIDAEYEYNPTWSSQSYYVDVTPLEFIHHYIGTFIRNPVSMTRAVIAREDAVWDIYPGKDSMLRGCDRTGTMDEDKTWRTLYPQRKYVSLYPRFLAVNEYTLNTQWISAVIWRAGLFTLLGAVLVVNLVIRGCSKGLLILFSPVLGHILSLLLSTGWADYRYFWPLNLLNMSLMLVMFVILKDKEMK